MKWERTAAGGGIVFVILVIVTQFGFGTPPSDGQGIINFYRDHHNAGLLRQLLSGLGGASFLFFVGALQAALRRHEAASSWGSSAMLAAAVTTSAVALVQAIVIYSLINATPSDASVAAGLQSIVAVTGRFLSLPLTVFLASASVSMLEGRSLPAWLGWLGLVAAAINLLSALRIALDFGGSLGSLALLSLAVWILVVSVLLSSGRGVSQAPA
jgi:hypothetical protein